MDRRRLVRAAPLVAALSGTGALVPGGALGQITRSSVPEYVGAMTVLRRSIRWVEQEVARLMDAQDREDEEWRIDVLAPFAVVDTVRDAALAIVPPSKYATGHELWLDAVDELVAAGLHLRNGVLADNERSYEFATRSLDRATVLLEEVEVFLPRRVRRVI